MSILACWPAPAAGCAEQAMGFDGRADRFEGSASRGVAYGRAAVIGQKRPSLKVPEAIKVALWRLVLLRRCFMSA